MSNLSDDIFTSSILGMILGLPIFVGIGILAIPFLIISGITGVPMNILIQNLLILVIAMFLIRLLCKHQIIENGIVGLIVGAVAYTYLGWHSLACVLVGVVSVGFLFFITNIKIGFWLKTLLFSVIVTFFIFMFLYSDVGLFPMSDKIWKTAFAIIFFLENLFIRCAIAYDSSSPTDEFDNNKNVEYHYDARQTESATEESYQGRKNKTHVNWFSGINNAEELKKRYRELMKIYHPDNQAGDTNAVQQIQEEYEELLKRY